MRKKNDIGEYGAGGDVSIEGPSKRSDFFVFPNDISWFVESGETTAADKERLFIFSELTTTGVRSRYIAYLAWTHNRLYAYCSRNARMMTGFWTNTFQLKLAELSTEYSEKQALQNQDDGKESHAIHLPINFMKRPKKPEVMLLSTFPHSVDGLAVALNLHPQNEQ